MRKISHKRTFAMFVCASLLLTIFMMLGEVRAPGDAGVNASPDLVEVSPGDNFTITFNVTNVDSMGVWQAVLKYNQTVMNVTSLWIPVDNVFGDPAIYMQQRGEPVYGTDFLDGLGYVYYGNSRFTGEVSVINSVLFQANCTALNEGTTTIQIATRNSPAYGGPRSSDTFATFLGTWSEQFQEYRDIPQPLVVKSVIMTSGNVVSRPIALFTVTASVPEETGKLVLNGHKPIGDTDFAQGYKNIPVMFNASASKGVVTFENGTKVLSNAGIATYHWNFGDGTAPVTTDTPTIEHTFENTGNWYVTLSVEDNIDPPQTSDVTQKLMVIGLVLDYYNWTPFVYTIFALIIAAIVFIVYREIRAYVRTKRELKARRLISRRVQPPSQSGL